MKSLAIFDIDGTLIKMPVRNDDEAFARAIKVELGMEIATEWSQYRNATDSGIVREVLEKRFSRPAKTDEIAEIKRRFISLINEHCAAGNLKCEANAGGKTAFERVMETGKWAAAIATGNWEASARVKLEAAGIKCEHIPLASADDAEVRADILKTAVQRSRCWYGIKEFAVVYYIGDRPWDYEAASLADVEFIGIAAGDRAAALREAGFSGAILPDLENPALLKALGIVAAGDGGKP